MSVLVFGQAGRDVVLLADELPGPGGATRVRQRRETLGGKGANQAVGLAQLGNPVSLVAVLGADPAGDLAAAQAARDGIDTSRIARRGTTALLVDIVAPAGVRRLFEHVPADQLLTAEDVRAAEDAVTGADTVVLQLQQPVRVLLPAAHRAAAAGIPIVLDGAPDDASAGAEFMQLATVLRADATEAALLAGHPAPDPRAALDAGRQLLDRGLTLVALAVPDCGDLLVWPGGHHLFGHQPGPALDPTGGGDTFVAGLVHGLRRGWPPTRTGQFAHAAAAATVTRLGGRPSLHALGTTDRDRNGPAG